MNADMMSHSPASTGNMSEDRMPGHWVLASMGKKVLRPGGVELTRRLVRGLRLSGSDVVEFAPGMGHTARELIGAHPRSYVGVDANLAAAETVRGIVGTAGRVVVGDAAQSGLPDASADVVIGEAMLTMHGDKAKAAIIAEAVRVLRPGGRYGIHELGLQPDNLPESIKTEVQQAISRTIRTNARPLTAKEWITLLEHAGLVVVEVHIAPMGLLQPKRMLADEGFFGMLRFIKNMLTRPQARQRVLGMRSIFKKYASFMNAVAIVAMKPAEEIKPQSTVVHIAKTQPAGCGCACSCS